jgi:hypothetical protein
MVWKFLVRTKMIFGNISHKIFNKLVTLELDKICLFGSIYIYNHEKVLLFELCCSAYLVELI